MIEVKGVRTRVRMCMRAWGVVRAGVVVEAEGVSNVLKRCMAGWT